MSQTPQESSEERISCWINPVSDWSSDPEEAANTITHGLGFVLSLVAAVVLVASVLPGGDFWRTLSCLVYAASLVAVYAMSTLSHWASDPALKRRFQILDQGFIYLLIVGTYTPFSLVFLRTTPWWIFLAVMWTIAIIGFFSKIILAHRIDQVLVWIYVVLGWMPIVAGTALVGVVPAAGLWWMLIGGLFYTVGTIFLVMDHRVPHFHALWHLCVIAGSTCHFFVILLCVVPTV